MRRTAFLALALAGAVAGAGVSLSAVAAEETGGKTSRLALSGANEFGPSGEPINPHGDGDRGSVVLTLNQGKGQLCWAFGALTMTAGEPLPQAAHIHQAPAGFAGGIVVHLFGSGGAPSAPTSYPTSTECVAVAPDLVKQIRKNPDRYYVNLHNSTHPAGVMRAQLG